MGEQSARNLMQVAEKFGQLKSPNFGVLPVSALYALSAPSTPDEARKEVEALVVDGEQLTVARCGAMWIW